MKSVFVAVAAAVMLATPGAAFPITFDDSVSLSDTQAPGAWYVDRYAPAGFQSQVPLLGDNRLRQSISASDGAMNRPPAFQTAFYNTQGRKLDLPAATTYASIELFVAGDWQSSGRRMAGLWATAVDSGDAVSFFPIIEFASLDSSPRFRAWNGGGWTDLGLPTGFAYDQFTTIGFRIDGSDIRYEVGDLSLALGGNGSTRFANVILQGHNTTSGVTYDIFWDNLRIVPLANAIPEPGTWAMMLAGFGLAGVCLRRRRVAAQPARV